MVFWAGCGVALGVSPRTFGVALAVALRRLVAVARLVRERIAVGDAAALPAATLCPATWQ